MLLETMRNRGIDVDVVKYNGVLKASSMAKQWEGAVGVGQGVGQGVSSDCALSGSRFWSDSSVENGGCGVSSLDSS